MGRAIIDLIPFIVGSAMVPVPIVIMLFSLRSPSGARTGIAFVAGMLIVKIVQGILFGEAAQHLDTGDGHNDSQTVKSMILLVLGILMLVKAGRKLFKAEDPDAPPPGWMTSISEMTPTRAFLVGVGVLALAPKHWFFTLGAIAVIHDANLDGFQSVIAYAIFVVLALGLVIAPVLAYALFPAASGPPLMRAGAWLERNTGRVVIAASLVFGTYFLWKALADLLA